MNRPTDSEGDPELVKKCSYPDMVSNAADGDNRVSGQKKVFSDFFSQSHWTKSVQITENNLPLCPVTAT